MSSNKSLAVLSSLAGAACVAAFVLVTGGAAEVEPPRPVVQKTVHAETRDEHNELLAAKSRERVELREDLQRAMDEIDAKLATEPKDAKTLHERRAILKDHMDAIDAVTENEWDVVKARIERSLGS
jgi:hypothetical protein